MNAQPAGNTDDKALDTAITAMEKELTMLWRRARAISQQGARRVHPDMEPAAYGLLVLLARNPSMRLTELSMHLGVGKPSLSRQVSFLESIGLLDKQADPADGRAQTISLTRKGRSQLDVVQKARKQAFRERVAAWPQEDVAELARLLRQLNDTYTADTAAHPEDGE